MKNTEYGTVTVIFLITICESFQIMVGTIANKCKQTEHSRGRLLCSCTSFPQQRDTMKVGG